MPGPGYMLWLEHTLTHHGNPRADCIGCFSPEDTPMLVIRGLAGLSDDPFEAFEGIELA